MKTPDDAAKIRFSPATEPPVETHASAQYRFRAAARMGELALQQRAIRIGQVLFRSQSRNGSRIMKFVSRPLVPSGEGFLTPAGGNAPPVPRAFTWDLRRLDVARVIRSWRSTKTDRGDTYLKRHWFELQTESGQKVVVYYDRAAPRGAAQWWLYTIDE